MYITVKIGKFQLAAANKNEYLMPPDEILLCKKGFRLQIGNYMWNKGVHKYTGIFKGWTNNGG